ncbi:MAG: TrkH family potassium uptake protein [Clostridia bacterium]|nr:TrkH family potassium uptake protein [Clostridia bacterium]
MNFKMVFNVLGKLLLVEAALLCLPLALGLLYGEETYLSFLIPIVSLLFVGMPALFLKPKDTAIYEKEGFVIVAFAWVIMSAIGALPFVISGAIPNYIDAFFESVSGFTTTGSSILNDIEALPKSILFWRSFTNWIGGMGVLVFALAIMPEFNSGLMHAFRAETTGPTSGKLVSKMTFTARILYGIYIALTLIETVFLLAGKMPLFDSICHAMATAGTGGFSIKNASIAAYGSTYIEMVIAVFMFLFGINFNMFYLILIGQFGRIFKNEELRVYFITTVVATIVIAINIVEQCGDFGQAIRYSFFQVTSLGSSTGFVTADYDQWPTLSKIILLCVMSIGGCAGSTGGGLKVSRLIILVKSSYADGRKMVRPRSVITVKSEGQPLQSQVIRNVRNFFVIAVGIVFVCTILISIEGSNGDVLTNFTASLSAINNTGPGLGGVGPVQNYSGYSYFAKILLSIVMLAGRLEIFPMLVLFSPTTWKRR